MITGILQRRWQATQPAVYDKETRIVCLDITPEVQKDEDGNDQNGYSFIPVEIDRQIDYGHIKSQLIEAGFAQKDEFGLLMNTVDNLIESIAGASSWAKFKEALDNDVIRKFGEFCAFRNMCAEAAHEVMTHY